MGKAVFNPEHKLVIDSFLLDMPGVVPGRVFGYPAYYIDKKLFACLYEEGVGIKVPLEVVEQLVGQEGIIHFQPLGRNRMREWVQVNRARSEDYLQDKSLFELSIKFVSSLEPKKK